MCFFRYSAMEKLLFTVATGIGFLWCMRSHVHLQMFFFRERFFTLVTGIRFLPCMRSYVHLQMSYLREKKFSLVTGIWFLSCMCSQVHFQISFFRKRFFHTGHRDNISPLYEFLFANSNVLREKKNSHCSQG